MGAYMDNDSAFVEVRQVTDDDAEDISRLCLEGLGYRCDRILVKNRISQLDPEREAVFVAVNNGTVVGFIHVELYHTLYFEPMANILGLSVSGKLRENGIGKLLLVQAENWADEHDITLMRLNTGANRSNAHEFYRHMGYRMEKEQYRFAKRLD